MRAVATWTGLIASEESKIDRIQKKQLLSIDTYLHDEKARKEALAGEDAMQIYLALWSYGFFDLDEACLWPGLCWLEAVCRRLADAEISCP